MFLPLAVVICLSAIQLCLGEQPVDEVVTTRTVPLLGGWSERSLESAQEATQSAVKMNNTRSSRRKFYTRVYVTGMRRQTFNSRGYKIVTVVGRNQCREGEIPDLDDCTLEKEHVKCHFEFTIDYLRNKREHKKIKCEKVVD